MDARDPNLNYCEDGGLLVAEDGEVPGDPTEFGGPGLAVPVGCNRLRCWVCQAWIRNAVGFKPVRDVHPSEIHAAEDWSKVPRLVERTEGGAGRLYACTCRAWVEAFSRPTDNPDPEESSFAWRCQGHPRVELPLEVDGVRIGADTDFGALFRSVAAGGLPPRARATEGEHLSSWLRKLYVRFTGTGARAAMSRAIGTLLVEGTPATRLEALIFFRVFYDAEGIERLVELGGHRELIGTDRSDFHATLGVHLRLAKQAVAGAIELARALAQEGPAEAQLYLALAERDPDWLREHAHDIARHGPAAWQELLLSLGAIRSELLEPVARAIVARDSARAEELRAFAERQSSARFWVKGKLLDALQERPR